MPSLLSFTIRGVRQITRPSPLLLRPSRFATSIGPRYLHISSTTPIAEQDIPSSTSTNPADSPDARFEVLGAPYSLLSVSLSASQDLYTRRGTLVGVNGKADNAVSTLSVLEPFRRAALGIPFLYQRISSTTPFSALIGTKSPITSFTVVHLDGRVDWMIAQRSALLAWTGHSLLVKPTTNTQLSLAHWGNSQVAGRGLLALAGKGNIYQINLKAGESYVAHPSNILAYTMQNTMPSPYRFKSSTMRLQVPGVNADSILPDTKFFAELRKTQVWAVLAQLLFNIRTWARQTIWGDRLFLQFQGPSTILLQSRGSRLTEVLTAHDVNEIADTPAGAVQLAADNLEQKENGNGPSAQQVGEPKSSAEPVQKGNGQPPTDALKETDGKSHAAEVKKDGKVEAKDS